MQTHAMPTLGLRHVPVARPTCRRVVTRASGDDSRNLESRRDRGSPNRHQKRQSSPLRERSSVIRGTVPNTTVPSAGGQGKNTHTPQRVPPIASMANTSYSSVATQVTYGNGETRTRLSRAELRKGLRARKKLRKSVTPSAVQKNANSNFEKFFDDDAEILTMTRDRRVVERFDPVNNVVRGIDRHGSQGVTEFERRSVESNSNRSYEQTVTFETFGEAFTEMERMLPIVSDDDADDFENSKISEFRDAYGEPFSVNITNVGSPPGLTTIELKGLDKANLLGALCSALAKAEVSVVSGTIATDVVTSRVKNTIHAYSSGTKQRLDPSVFESLSVRILSACWTADDRKWLNTTRSVGKFIVDRRRPTARELDFGVTNAKHTVHLNEAVERTEAAMRASSARLADAVERCDDTNTGLNQALDVTLRNLLVDVETAAAAASLARQALDAATQPRGIPGFAQAPAYLTPSQSLDDFLYMDYAVADGNTEVLGATTDAHTTDFSKPSLLTPFQNKFNTWYDGISPFFKGVFFMNVASCLFGTNQVVIKQVADAGVDDFTQMFLRFFIAGVPLVPFIWQGMKGSNSKELLRGATHLGTILAVGYFLQIIGLEGTTSAKGALTSTFTVLSVPIFAGMAGQRVPWFTWPASIAAMVGVGLLTGGDGSSPVAGDAICILSAIIFGYHTLQSSKYAQLFEDQELPFISFQIGVVAVESGLWKLGEMGYHSWVNGSQGSGGAIDVSLSSIMTSASTQALHLSDQAQLLPWPALLWMGLATTSFTLWIEFLALKNVSASTCALIYTAEPLWGALFAWHFMGDRWGVPGWIGAFFIVGASVGSQLMTFGEDEKEEEEGADANTNTKALEV